MSGSPLITSNGTVSGSATLWFYERGTQQLRAEAANVGAGPNFTQLFSATVGNPGQYTKFIDVAADNNRILVTADVTEWLMRQALRARAYSVIAKPINKNGQYFANSENNTLPL